MRIKKRRKAYMEKWIPTIEIETARGTREVTLMTRNLMERKIFLLGTIDSEMANSFVLQMLYLDNEDKPVDIIINSPGGEVNAGLLIYDIIQSCRNEVNIYCAGLAASMAAIILAGGEKGHRFILPHSKVMIHEPLIAGGIGGSATSIRNISDSILETRALANGILAKHTGKTVEEIDEATSFDNYMNAEQAVAFGLCDKVVEGIGR